MEMPIKPIFHKSSMQMTESINESINKYQCRPEGSVAVERSPAQVVLDQEDEEDVWLMNRDPLTLLPAHVVILEQQLHAKQKQTKQNKISLINFIYLLSYSSSPAFLNISACINNNV